MEEQGNSALPEDRGSSKGSKTKLIAIIIVAVLVIAAIGAALLFMGGEDDKTAISISADSEIIAAGESVALNASASVGPDGKVGSITGYTWQFGDGNTETKTVDNVSHTYAYPGKYIVLLTLTNNDDKTFTDYSEYLIITVTNPDGNNITAIVSANNNVVKPNTEVEFDASLSTATDGNITNFAWTFGDSNTTSGNITAAGIVDNTYVTENTLFTSYVVLTSANYTQRYYNSILVVAAGSSSGETKIFVRETIGGDPDSLDPAVDYETAGGEVLQNVYETLIWYDGGSAVDLKPMLATEVPTIANGLISADGLNYTFNLREGVVMHDGTIMDAEDVEYSLERVLTMNDPNGPAWCMGQVMVSNFSYGGELDAQEIANSVEITGDMQVTIHLMKPYPAFIYVMAYTEACIVSKEYVEMHGGVQVNQQNTWMQKHCCGSGPYQLDVWQPGIQIVLKSHEDYWQGEPNLDIVVIKNGVTDFGARLLHLKAGVVNSIDVPRSQIGAMVGVDGIYISKGNTTFALDFVGMNQNITDPASSGIDIGDIPLDFFTDVNVRKAFACAFNYSLNIALNYKGTAVEPNSPIPSGMLGWDDSVPVWDFNLTLAEQYLGAAINPDTGHSWLDDGFTIYIYYNSENTVRRGTCDIMKQGLESLSPDIKVIPVGITWSVYLGHLYSGDLPVFVLGWSTDYADPDDFVQPFLKDGGTYGGPLGFNNDTLSDMVDEAATELNTTARLNLYSDIQQACYDECLYIWTAQATNYRVMLDTTTGYVFNPMYAAWYYFDIDVTG